jgi:hypothetical protein
METPPSPNARNSLRKITLYVIVGFAVVGLISGFGVAGLTRSNSAGQANLTPTPSVVLVTQIVQNVTPTPTKQPVVDLGLPKIVKVSSDTLAANGVTDYTVQIQAVDKKKKEPIHAPDITCKAWLVQRIPDTEILQIDNAVLTKVDNLKQSITGKSDKDPNKSFPEISGMGFDATTPQTGFCDPDGTKTWKYTIATGTPPGDYDIVFLTDWQGIRWNWSWIHVQIS